MQITDTINMAMHHIAALNRADTCRRAGHNDVAGGKHKKSREIADRFRNFPDQLVKVALLTPLTIYIEPDGTSGKRAGV